MQAEIDVINESWNVGGTSNGLADSVGLMVYEGTQVNINQNIVGGFKFYIKQAQKLVQVDALEILCNTL